MVPAPTSAKSRTPFSLAAGLLLILVLLAGWRLVRGPAGSPASGIGPVEEEPATSGAEGLAVLPNAAPREPGRVEVGGPQPAGSAVEPAAETSPPGRLSGGVFGPDGAPLEEFWVHLLLEGGERLNAERHADGSYALEDIPLGRRRVTASSLHHHDGVASLLFSARVPELTQDFVLRPEQRIRVRLTTSAGEAALPALAEQELDLWGWNLVPVATRDDPGQTFEGVVGSLNNRFGIGTFWQVGYRGLRALTPDEYGTVDLHEEGSAWMSLVAAHQVLGKQRVDAATESVTFVVDFEDFAALYASVRGRLVDGQDGTPIVGTCSLSENPFPPRQAQPTELDGSFQLEEQLPGKRWLIAQAEGRARLVSPVELAAGEDLDLGELSLYEPISLSGRTVDAAGGALEAVVACGRLDPRSGEVDWIGQRSMKSDEAGAFRVAGLEPGLWVLRSPGLPARPPRPHDARMASGCLRVDARAGSVGDLELVLHDTGSVMLVSERVEEPWPRARALDPSGLPVGSAWIGRWAVESPLHLPPGPYTLVISRDGVELERHSISVGDKPLRFEFDFAD